MSFYRNSIRGSKIISKYINLLRTRTTITDKLFIDRSKSRANTIVDDELHIWYMEKGKEDQNLCIPLTQSFFIEPLMDAEAHICNINNIRMCIYGIGRNKIIINIYLENLDVNKIIIDYNIVINRVHKDIEEISYSIYPNHFCSVVYKNSKDFIMR